MKHIARLLNLLGFTFQYLVPLVLFSGVIPYTHEGVAAGLTKMGYVAVAIAVFLVCHKLEKQLERIEDNVARVSLSSLFPIAKWALVGAVLSAFESFVVKLVGWWWQMLIFIVIGRLLFILAAAIHRKGAA